MFSSVVYFKSKQDSDEFEVPETEESKENYLSAQKEDMHKRIQRMEAQNRWRVLEYGTPDHDITQLKVKDFDV